MKKFISVLLTVLMTFGILCMAVSAAGNSKGISFSSETITIELGTSVTLKPTVTGLSGKTISWSSSNESVATVTSAGKVTAKKNGSCKIYAKIGTYEAKVAVTVGKRVKSVKLGDKKATLKAGQTFVIKPEVTPSNAANKYLSYTSSNEAVATVTDKGVITAVSAGSATITVKSTDGTNKKAKIKITVKDLGSSEIKAEPTADFDVKMNAFDITEAMRVGWNLGNTLDSTGNWINSDDPLKYETAWGNPVTTKELIDAVSKEGFRTIRIPTSWHDHLDKDYNIDEKWMARVKEIVDYAYANDMYIILNLHHDNSFYNLSSAVKSVKEYNKLETRFRKVWKQIAKEFKDYDEHLILESMNEPRIEGSAKEWTGGTPEERAVINNLNLAFVDVVRSTGGNNAYRFLAITTHGANSSESIVKELVIPNDERVIVNVHAYAPYNFAMNGDGPATFTENDEKELENFYAMLGRVFTSKGIAVIVDEVGATNKDNTADRVKWAKVNASEARKNKITVVWWDNGGFGKGGEKFGLINRNDYTWTYKEIADALVKYSK